MDFSIIFGYPLGWVMWLFYQVVKNYGIAILLFTLFTRVLLYPLGVKQMKSSARMAIFQPKITALQKKYKNNKQKLQEEQMKLYEEEGYNPMSGCLPMLIQFPILFGLINVIYNPLTHMLRISDDLIARALEIAQGLEGFVQTTSQISIINAVKADPGAFSSLGADFVNAVENFDLNFLGFNMGEVAPFAWDWLVLIPILSGVTSILMTFISMKFSYTSRVQGAQQMNGMTKGMMFIMPLFSLFFAFQVPVGVVYYWILTNVFMALQTLILYKIYTPEKMEKVLEEDKKKKKKKKTSRYQQALKAAAQQQQGRQPDLVEDENGMVTYKGEVISKKEANRRRLAEARRRDAEKYGEEYKEVTDDDLR
ncbi:MAG: YidC/Oxa1 family membrane protein insertase [Oscillospiraceae bacterium]|nr:YidC/Oxa1 family membrane protein insertase [Oscillospiraceae bacterium]